MEIISRQDAKALGLKRYFTGTPCKHGHICERQVSNSACVVCHREGVDRHYAANAGAILKTKRAYHVKKRAERSAYNRIYYERNRDKFAESNRLYYVTHSDHLSEAERRRAKDNPAKFAARYARKRATELQAMPKWLTADHHAQIERLYAEAKRLTLETGVVWHVDHEIPLRGRNVSGLHVPWNLRVIPAVVNQRKSNKHVG